MQKKNTVLFTLLLGAVLTASAARLPTIPVSAEQADRTGIATAPVVSSVKGEPTGAGISLPGMAAFPTRAIQLISAPAAGVIEAILVNPMEHVAAGAPLVTLRSPQLLEWQREYVQANVQAKLAAEKFRRDQALFKEGIIAESRLRESRGAMIQSEAAQRELRQMLKIAGMSSQAIAALSGSHAMSPVLSISSPRQGIIVEQLVSLGQRVESGAPLAKVAQQDQLWIELQATRQQSERIQPGDAVQLEGCPQTGKVIGVNPQLQEASQTVVIRVEFSSVSSCVRPNQHVEGIVGVRSQDAAALMVKATALIGNAGKEYVFVRDGTGFRPVEVKVMARDRDSASVLGPIRAGDEVAVQGLSTLKGMWLGFGATANENRQ